MDLKDNYQRAYIARIGVFALDEKGAVYFLVKNDDNIHAINKENFDINKPIIISSKRKEVNWLPSGNEKKFHITLRIYNPEKDVYENLESIKLPEIKRIEL